MVRVYLPDWRIFRMYVHQRSWMVYPFHAKETCIIEVIISRIWSKVSLMQSTRDMKRPHIYFCSENFRIKKSWLTFRRWWLTAVCFLRILCVMLSWKHRAVTWWTASRGVSFSFILMMRKRMIQVFRTCCVSVWTWSSSSRCWWFTVITHIITGWERIFISMHRIRSFPQQRISWWCSVRTESIQS